MYGRPHIARRLIDKFEQVDYSHPEYSKTYWQMESMLTNALFLDSTPDCFIVLPKIYSVFRAVFYFLAGITGFITRC